jgi:hypothetical protein
MKWLFALCIALAPVAASAQVTISSLPAAAPMSGTEVLPVIQSGSTKRTTASDIVQIITKGAKFSPNGGIGSASSTVTSGEPTGGTFAIDGQTGIGSFGGGTLYPRILGSSAGGAAKYDAAGVLLTNSIGAKTGLFGLAAKDGVQWPNSYISGVDSTGHAQVYSISTTGNYGGVFAARSSDNPGANQNVIGHIGLCVADNTSQSDVCWAGYDATYIRAGATSRGAFGREISLINEGSTPALGDPYNYNVNGFLNALRLDCGDGIAVSHGCSSAMTIVPNNGQALAGIVFGDGALIMQGGYAPAIAMPSSYGIDWYTSTATPAWRISSNASGSILSQMTLGDNAFDMFMNNGSAHPFSVSPSGISALAYKVGSTSGVSCAAGTVSLTTLVVMNGLVTHC